MEETIFSNHRRHEIVSASDFRQKYYSWALKNLDEFLQSLRAPTSKAIAK